jgi:hypothetical protein
MAAGRNVGLASPEVRAVAAIIYFQKTHEDYEYVTYRFGPDEENPEDSFVITKAVGHPIDDPKKATVDAQLALSGIRRGYRKLGRWPDRGAGYT